MSNSKLVAEQKRFLKNLKLLNPKVFLFSFPDSGVTVAIQRTGKEMGRYSVSIASDTETRFRRKVGEYLAFCRMVDGISLPVRLASSELWEMLDEDILYNVAEAIAESVS